ncbi:MAG: ATP-dependent helicase [Verrucomicrobiota bacterium]|nr:ATP-dependent helicase [Verrucomicrobiota bacterium]
MDLNKEQLNAIKERSSHALILAGAGTGKTRTIIAKAAQLIKEGTKPERILLLTFTRRAAKEMITRLQEIIGTSADRIEAGTFHRFCLMTMRKMPKLFGLENTTVIDRDDQLNLMKLVRAPFRAQGEDFPKPSEIISLFSYVRNTNQPFKEYCKKFTEHDEEMTARIIEVCRRYTNKKRDNKYIDYDDILHIFVKKLYKNKKTASHIGKLYDFVLVDEMQDTNPLQWFILNAMKSMAKLFCVGDDAQSIYAFRGADFKNIHSFKDRVKNAEILYLNKNYRSTQEILDFANWLLNKSPLNYNKELTSFRGEGIMPRLMDFEDQYKEAEWIAENLLQRKSVSGVKWSDHMVIVRSSYTARSLETKLTEKKIPYKLVGGTSLMQTAHVKDVFAMLRAAINNHDEMAWLRYLTLWRGIGNVTASKLILNIDKINSSQQIVAYLRKNPKYFSLATAIEEIYKVLNNPSSAIKKTIDILEPILEKKYDKWETRKKDLKLILSLAKKHKKISAFLETYTLDPITSSEAKSLASADKVTLITAHSAKGTESPVCYILKAEPGQFPHYKSMETEDQIEEERRILYVAITRAQNELILTRTSRSHSAISHYSPAASYNKEAEKNYFLSSLPEDIILQEKVEDEDSSFYDFDDIDVVQTFF